MKRVLLPKAKEAPKSNGHNPLFPSSWRPGNKPGVKATGNPSNKQQQQQQQVQNMNIGAGARDGLSTTAFRGGPERRQQGQRGLPMAAGGLGANPYHLVRPTDVKPAPGHDQRTGPLLISPWVAISTRLNKLRSQRLEPIITNIPAVLPSNKPSQGMPTRRATSAPLRPSEITPFSAPRSAPLIPGRKNNIDPPSQPPPELPPVKSNQPNRQPNWTGNNLSGREKQGDDIQYNSKMPRGLPSGPPSPPPSSNVMPQAVANKSKPPAQQTSNTLEPRVPLTRGARIPVAKGPPPDAKAPPPPGSSVVTGQQPTPQLAAASRPLPPPLKGAKGPPPDAKAPPPPGSSVVTGQQPTPQLAAASRPPPPPPLKGAKGPPRPPGSSGVPDQQPIPQPATAATATKPEPPRGLTAANVLPRLGKGTK